MRQLIRLHLLLVTSVIITCSERHYYNVKKLANKCVKATHIGVCPNSSLSEKIICNSETFGLNSVLKRCEPKGKYRARIVCCPKGSPYRSTTIFPGESTNTESPPDNLAKMTMTTAAKRTTTELLVKSTTKKVMIKESQPPSTQGRTLKTTHTFTTKISKQTTSSKPRATEKQNKDEKENTDSRPQTAAPQTKPTSRPLEQSTANQIQVTELKNEAYKTNTTSSQQELKPQTTVAGNSCNFKKSVEEFKRSIPLKQKKCAEFESYQQEVSDLWRAHDANMAIIRTEMVAGRKRYDLLVSRNKVMIADLKINRTLEIWKESLKSFEEQHEHGLIRVSSTFHKCIFTQLKQKQRNIMVKFIGWIQSSSASAGDGQQMITIIAEEFQSYQEDFKKHKSRISNSFFLKPKVQQTLLRELENQDAVLKDMIGLAKCTDKEQGNVGGARKTRIWIKILMELNATKENQHEHKDIQKGLEHFMSKHKFEWIKTTDQPSSTASASGEDNNGHGSGEGEYSGDNSDTESSGDNNREGSGRDDLANNDDEDTVRNVYKPTTRFVRRPQRTTRSSSSYREPTTSTEKYRPTFLRFLTTTKAPSEETRLKLAIKRLLNEYPSETKGCDQQKIERRGEESRMAFARETSSVVDRWDAAEKKYSKMKLKDYRKAERFLLKVLATVTKSINDLRRNEQTSDEENRRNRAECINRQILKNQRNALVAYTKEIQKPNLSMSKIMKHIRRFIDVCHHLDVYKLQHSKRGEEYTVRYKMKEHIKALNQNIKKMLKLLEYLPKTELIAKIKREIWLAQINFTFKTIQEL